MHFEWGLKKAAANKRKHGVSFEEATTALRDQFSATAHDPDHSRFKVQGSGFKVQGSRFRVQGSGFKVQGWEVQGSRFKVGRFRVQGSRFRVGRERKMSGIGCFEDIEGWQKARELTREI
ncbi:MAG: BrnT family toxin, partial [Chlorobium sp.]